MNFLVQIQQFFGKHWIRIFWQKPYNGVEREAGYHKKPGEICGSWGTHHTTKRTDKIVEFFQLLCSYVRHRSNDISTLSAIKNACVRASVCMFCLYCRGPSADVSCRIHSKNPVGGQSLGIGQPLCFHCGWLHFHWKWRREAASTHTVVVCAPIGVCNFNDKQ